MSALIRPIKHLLVITMVALLAACGSTGYVPIQDLAISSNGTASIVLGYKPKAPAVYKVKAGDTLFAIAWRYGWDYKKLAQLNNIPAPYTIYVGQKIAFNTASASQLAPVAKSTAKATSKSVAKTTTTSVSKPKTTTSKVVSPVMKPYKGASNIAWQWPIQGRLVETFNSKSETSKGVDIAAKPGSSVTAAAAGQIVYAGDGIQGYGNLLIIKHNDTYLSAYAYNNRLLVKEGDIVKRGQLIAQSGKGPQLDGRLHFEIRKDGKPVNPQSYLPRL